MSNGPHNLGASLPGVPTRGGGVAAPQQVRELFDSVSELTGSARTSFLLQVKTQHPEVYAELDELLRLSETESPFFDSGARNLAGIIIGKDKQETLPRQLGKFMLQRVLGEGGMGVVYLAQEDFPRRTVALKLVRPEVTTPGLVRRLTHEATTLALLRHAGIAQIYEAGFVDDQFGRKVPYIAMEYVDGPSLLQFVRERTADTRAKLTLMAGLCDAVDHAHRRGVVHRDLKPGNVLVTNDGQPKVLDFGIARLTDVDGHTTQLTGAGLIVGTLNYMSPEQVSGDVQQIDSRCDVYALGVMLFEVLAGRLPIDVKSLHVAAAAAKVRQDEPPRLSTLDRSWRGDIEAIVAKALEKDPKQRYQSAAELAADIRRYLNDEPVMAAQQTVLYQVSKLVRRNKGLTAAASAVAGSLVLAAGVAIWKGAEAQRAARTTQNIGEYLKEVLMSPSPDVGRGRDVSVRALLEASGPSIDERFADDPVTRRELHSVLGRTLFSLGEDARAEEHFVKALALTGSTTRGEQTKTVEWMVDRARCLQRLDRWDEAEPILRDAFARANALFGSNSPETAYVEVWLGATLTKQCHFPEAKAKLQAAIDTLMATRGEQHPWTALAWARMTELHWYQGQDIATWFERFEYATQITSRVLGPDHPETLMCQWMAADAQLKAHTSKHVPLRTTLEDVMAAYTSASDALTRVLGADHPETIRCLQSQQRTLRMLGNSAASLEVSNRIVAATERRMGPTHIQTILALNERNVVMFKIAPLEETEAAVRDTLARLHARDKPSYLEFDTRRHLGSVLRARKNFTAARDAQLGSVTFALSTGKGSLDRVGQALLHAGASELDLVVGGGGDRGRALQMLHDGLACFDRTGWPTWRDELERTITDQMRKLTELDGNDAEATKLWDALLVVMNRPPVTQADSSQRLQQYAKDGLWNKTDVPSQAPQSWTTPTN